MSNQSIKQAERAALYQIAGYLLLGGGKFLLGFLCGSYALSAYGMHTTAAGLRQLSMLLRLREETPRSNQISIQGSRKHFILTVAVSALLLVIGTEFMMMLFRQVQSGAWTAISGWAMGCVAAAVLLTEGLQYLQSRSSAVLFPKLNKMITRKRLFGRLASVIVLLALGGAWLGTLLQWPHAQYMDAVGGALLSLLILRTGYLILLESRIRVMGEVLEPDDKADLIRHVQRVKGVITVDGLTVHEQGHFVMIDLKISVNPSISVQDGQEIARMVKHHLMKRFMHIADVRVTVQPYNGGYPYSRQVDRDSGQLPIVH